MRKNKKLVIVSGLPRSGTSLMMNILSSRFKPIVDNKRKNNEDNPKGYFEHEKIKKLNEDNKWLLDEEGDLVKVISRLLIYIPDSLECKIIFMRRNINEIIESQKKMLIRKNIVPPDDFDNLKEIFEKHLREIKLYMKAKINMSFIEINFSDLVLNPLSQSDIIANFLKISNGILDFSCIDEKLYRNKNE